MAFKYTKDEVLFGFFGIIFALVVFAVVFFIYSAINGSADKELSSDKYRLQIVHIQPSSGYRSSGEVLWLRPPITIDCEFVATTYQRYFFEREYRIGDFIDVNIVDRNACSKGRFLPAEEITTPTYDNAWASALWAASVDVLLLLVLWVVVQRMRVKQKDLAKRQKLLTRFTSFAVAAMLCGTLFFVSVYRFTVG